MHGSEELTREETPFAISSLLPSVLARKSVGLELGERFTPVPLAIIWSIRSSPVEGKIRDSIGDGSRREFHPRAPSAAQMRGLALRRRAALPAMADRKESRDALAKDDEIDGDEIRQGNKDGSACHELPRMSERLAERTVRRVIVYRIFVAWRPRGMIDLRVSYTCANRDQVCALDSSGGLRAVNVALDDERLDCQSHESEENQQNAQARRLMRHPRRGRSFARGTTSPCVAIVAHPACQRALSLVIETRLPEISLPFHPL